MTHRIAPRRRTASFFPGIVLTLFAIIFGANAVANAAAEEPPKVIAHIALPGTAVRQMFLQQRDGKQYIYLQQGAHFTVVDVTDPKSPNIVERVASRGSLEWIQSSLALTATPEKGQPSTVSTQVLNVMDMSDPAHPKTIQTFSGVTSIMPDDTRQLVYIANNEGLTVLSHKQPYIRPLCTSEDAMKSDPECR
jgi:LVIVD repeat